MHAGKSSRLGSLGPPSGPVTPGALLAVPRFPGLAWVRGGPQSTRTPRSPSEPRLRMCCPITAKPLTEGRDAIRCPGVGGLRGGMWVPLGRPGPPERPGMRWAPGAPWCAVGPRNDPGGAEACEVCQKREGVHGGRWIAPGCIKHSP